MIHLEERGRRLRITVGGVDDPDSEVFDIEPVNAVAGATLLQGFVGIMANLVGEPSGVFVDITRLSLGYRDFLDPEMPTSAEQARRERFNELWVRYEDLRPAEQLEVMQAAFFWQTQGGLEAAKHIEEGGEDGYPKAIKVLERASGLEILSTLISIGNSSESEKTSTASPDTSSPSKSGASFKAPQDHLPKANAQKQR